MEIRIIEKLNEILGLLKGKAVPDGKWAKHVARKKKEHQDWWEDTDTVAGLHEK